MKNSRTRPGENPRFWIISLLFHLVAVGALFLTPAGQRFISRDERPVRPEIVRQDEELADVVDQIRALAIGRLKGAIGEIKTAGEEMEEKLVTEARSYQSYAHTQIAAVPGRIARQSEGLIRAQRALLGALEEFSRTRDPAALKAAFGENRAAITEGQSEMRRALQLAGAAGREPATRQETLEDEQFAVFELITSVFEKQADHDKLRTRLAEFSRENEALHETVAQATPRMEILQPQIAATEQTCADLFQATRKAEARVGQRKADLAKAEKRGQGVEAARAALEAAGREFTSTRAELIAARESRKILTDELGRLRREVSAAGKRLPVLEKEIPAMTTRLPALAREGDAALASALPAQRRVGETQEKLCDDLATLLRGLPASSQEDGP